MPLIDAEGRVSGRWNPVDVLLVALLLVALPAGFGAAQLLRSPTPVLREVAPAVLSQGGGQQVEIRGEHLRPYMRVSFGVAQGHGFLYYGPSQAFVPLPPLAPGTYDVVLYDYMREVARLPGAVTILASPVPPPVQLEVMGAFTGLSREMALAIAAGQTMHAPDGMVGNVTAVGDARPSVARIRFSETITASVPQPDLLEVPATLRLTCTPGMTLEGVLRCSTGGVVLAPDATLMLQGAEMRIAFRIEAVHADTATVAQP